MRKLTLVLLLIVMAVVANGCRKTTTQTSTSTTSSTQQTTSATTNSTTATTAQLPRFNSAIARSGEVANSIRIIASAEDSSAVIYFMIIPESAEEPNHAQIKAGVDYNGVTVIDKGSAVGEIVEDRTTGIVGGTIYKVAFVLELNGVFSQVYYRTATATSDDDLVDRGDGSMENPFWVETVADLQKVGTGTDGWANALHYILKNDIDLTGVEWSPIGRNEDGTFIKFNGTFDGNDHVISNVTVNNKICYVDPLDASKNEKSGFFCELDVDGVIKNFHLQNVNIIANEKRVGGIVGYSKGKLENVSVVGGTITGTNASDSQVGGIVGAVYEFGSISKAFTDVTVKGEGKRIGGIVGSIDASDKSTENLVISDVYTLGDVIGLTALSNQVGGIAGYSRNTTIERAYASGNIYGTTDVGGIAGFMQKRSSNTLYDGQPQLKNSFYMGSQVVAKGDANGANRVGGLVGNISTNNNTNAVLENNYANDTVILGGKVGTTAYAGTSVLSEKFVDSTWLTTNLTGWDFANVWEIKTSAVRPVLKGMNDTGVKVEHPVDLLIYDVLANKGETAGSLLINAKTNKTGNVYYVVVLKGQTSPTAAEVKAGINYGDVTVVASGSALNTKVINETKTLLINTEYDLYVYAEAGSEIALTKVTGITQDITTAEKLTEAKNGLDLGGTEVTGNLPLPLTGLQGSTISWSSSNTEVLGNDGTITKPNSNTEVILTATITISGESVTKTFNLTVLGKTVEEKLAEAKEALTLDYTIVNTNVSLPSKGLHDSDITWGSSHPDVIAVDGTFTSPIQDTIVTLTATISINGQTVTKDFAVTATGVSIAEKLDEAKNALSIDTEVSMNMNLPLSGLNGTTISWVSSQSDVLSNEGLITKPNENTNVILTATIALNGEVVTKEFTVTVLGKTVVEKLAEASDDLDLEDETTSDLILAPEGLHGSTIAWDSSHPEVISTTGIYVRPNTSLEVTLTATLTIGEESVTKVFVVYAIGNEVLLPWGGEDPVTLGYYPIYSVSDLEAFRDGINNLSIDSTSTFKLVRNIDMSNEYGAEGKNWAPILDFAGTFDGNNLTINGLYINSTAIEIGLFADTKVSAVIRNVNLTNVNVTGGTATGALVGMFKGIIENVSIIGGIVSTANHADSRIGGLVGRINEGTISKVTVDVAVFGGKNVGGVIGHADYLSGSTTEVVISGIVSYSNVFGKENVGGIAGYLRVTLRRAIAYGTITENTLSTHTTLKSIAGIAGYFQSNSGVTIPANIDEVIAANSLISVSNTSTSLGVAPITGSTSTTNGPVTSGTNLYKLDTIVIEGKTYSHSLVGTDITTAQFTDVNWFATNLPNFDFTTTWQIVDGNVNLR